MSIVDRGGRDGRRPRSHWPSGGEWRSSSRFRHVPPPQSARTTGTYVLAAICIGVFLLAHLSGPDMVRSLERDYSLVPLYLRTGEEDGWLRLLTHIFLHGGWVHLLFNMIVLVSFGRPLEMQLGTWRFVTLFLVGGMVAAYGHSWIEGFPAVPMIGASGAASAVVGAAALAAPRMLVIFFIVPMPLYLGVVVLVGFHLAAIAFDWDPQIAWWAHLVGLAAGAALYPLLRRRV